MRRCAEASWLSEWKGTVADCCVFVPADWLVGSHGPYITRRPAGWQHCLCLSLNLFCYSWQSSWVSRSVSPTLVSFLPLLSLSDSPSSLFLSVSHFFVSSNSGVLTLAKISLQLVWDWAHLFLWFTEFCVLCWMRVRIWRVPACALCGHVLMPEAGNASQNKRKLDHNIKEKKLCS